MSRELTEFERKLVMVAVAAAPELSDDQAVELKRVLKPYLSAAPARRTVPAARHAA
jgi:hypothetical protein